MKRKKSIFLFFIGILMMIGGIYLLKSASIATHAGLMLGKKTLLIYSSFTIASNILQILGGMLGLIQPKIKIRYILNLIIGLLIILSTIVSEAILLFYFKYRLDLAVLALGIGLPIIFIVATYRKKSPLS